MKFYKIDQKTPKEGQWCFIRQKIYPSGQVSLNIQPRAWYSDRGFGFGSENVVEWAPAPKHILVETNGWLSPYRGDDWPERDCECIVCCADDNPYATMPRYAYFIEELDRFLGNLDVVAFQYV